MLSMKIYLISTFSPVSLRNFQKYLRKNGLSILLNMTDQLKKFIRYLIKNSLNLSPNEKLLIVTDETLTDVGEIIWQVAKRITPELITIKFFHKSNNGNQLPLIIRKALVTCDAGIVLTQKYLEQSLFNEARQNGSRVIVVQSATTKMIERACNTNYTKIAMVSRKLADLMSIGKKLEITTPSGSEATVSLQKTKGIPKTGMAQNPGEFTFLPAGEACIILNGKYISGKIIIDRIAGKKKKLQYPITLNLNKGQITQIKGKSEAEILRKEIRKFGPNGRKIYELGIGTNDNILFGYSHQEDDKSYGNVHISFGENQKTKVHSKITEAIKGLLLKPTIHLDGKKIIEDGNILV